MILSPRLASIAGRLGPSEATDVHDPVGVVTPQRIAGDLHH